MPGAIWGGRFSPGKHPLSLPPSPPAPGVGESEDRKAERGVWGEAGSAARAAPLLALSSVWVPSLNLKERRGVSTC